MFVCVCVQFVWHHPRSEQCAAASYEPVRPDQHGRSALTLHHLHAHRDQVRVHLSVAAKQHTETRLDDFMFPSLLQLEIPSVLMFICTEHQMCPDVKTLKHAETGQEISLLNRWQK